MKTEIDLAKIEGWSDEPFADCENPDVPYAKWVLMKLSEKPKDVLDVGCGSGVHTKWFNDNGMKCFGITINKTDVLTKKDEHVMFGSMCEIPFPANTFDLVFCLGALEHTTLPYLAMTEFNRVLKTGGYLFVDMPGLENFHIINTVYWYHKMILFPIQIKDMMLKTNFDLVDGNWEEEIIHNPADGTAVEYKAKSMGIYLGKKKGDMKWKR